MQPETQSATAVIERDEPLVLVLVHADMDAVATQSMQHAAEYLREATMADDVAIYVQVDNRLQIAVTGTAQVSADDAFRYMRTAVLLDGRLVVNIDWNMDR